MAEIKTLPVKAQHFDSWHELVAKSIAGSISFSRPDSDGEIFMSYVCPCGCGHQSNLLVGNKVKPTTSPSWTWNGSLEAPVLSPSVNHVGHWHGWLGGSDGAQPGVWVSA